MTWSYLVNPVYIWAIARLHGGGRPLAARLAVKSRPASPAVAMPPFFTLQGQEYRLVSPSI